MNLLDLLSGSFSELNIDAVVSELAMHDCRVSLQTTGRAVQRIFQEAPLLPGVVVTDGEVVVGSLSRGLFTNELNRLYGQEIFLPRPIEAMAWLPLGRQLVLKGDETIVSAARAAMERPAADHHEPLLVDLGDGDMQLLDVQHLLRAQSHIHQVTILLYREANRRRREADGELRQAQQRLVQSAHQSGKAEIATDILHNVGNALNSLNISSTVLREKLERVRLDFMEKVVDLCRTDPTLLTHWDDDPRTEYVVRALEKLLDNLKGAFFGALSEADNLQKHLTTINGIIRDQENYVAMDVFREELTLSQLTAELVDGLGLKAQGFEVVTAFDVDPVLFMPRAKLQQALRVVLRNAADAMKGMKTGRRIEITLREEDGYRLGIRDHGVGITEAEHQQIFRFGYTTKVGGSGFGIHYCANVMKGLEGAMAIHSAGRDQGTEVVLTFPHQPVTV